ncbi:hypothetical protein JIN85_00395 [Luteolibacter pohnpeiensis]|uniref:Uncharacterized protein n=1 Tax=Luteolibacter pohnpeiensis TaxID=454153 RepID=A0A934S8M4_9BACT|nr:hypothetical protein [Luteolibacter pohnpeiensis]MBK1880848.1 hypothetical protein [Luteolibacter pohnpeiensis]
MGPAHGQALVDPPFGLRWGDSPEKLIDWASRHSLDVTISLPGDQPALRVVRIQPRSGYLPDTKAAAVEGRFLTGRMYELTVDYSDPSATSDIILARFEDLRKQLGAEYGALTTDRKNRTMEDQYVTRTESCHREPVKGLILLLALTEVEDLLRQKSEAKVSLIYRNENLRLELVKAEKAHQPEK